MRTNRCKVIPFPEGQDQGTLDLIESSEDHMKIMLLIQHLTKDVEMVGGESLYDFLFNCSLLRLRFSMVDREVKNFEQILENKIKFLIVDLYNLAYIDTQDNEKGEIISFSVLDEDEDLASWGPQEKDYLDSAVHSMDNIDNMHDTPLIVFDSTTSNDACPWVMNKEINF